jgi:hypothetical protein
LRMSTYDGSFFQTSHSRYISLKVTGFVLFYLLFVASLDDRRTGLSTRMLTTYT